MRLGFGLVCALAAGCYSPGYRDCEVTCNTGACPSGLSCEQGYCRLPGETASCSAILMDGGDDTMVDAGDPFGTPMPLTLVGNNDHDPTLTDNMTELFTMRLSGANEDIWRYARADPTMAFGNPQLESALSTAAQNEEGPDISGDGTLMFFIRDGTSLRDINSASRPTGATWTAVSPVNGLDPGGNSANPCLSRDRLMAVFERLDETQYSLWQATRTSTGAAWGPVQPITSLPIAGGVKPHSPMLSTDKLTIYFHARGTSGSDDIFEAHRPSVTEPFAAATPVAGVNTASEQEQDPWISEDGKTIVFVRSQGSGTLVMIAQRP